MSVIYCLINCRNDEESGRYSWRCRLYMAHILKLKDEMTAQSPMFWRKIALLLLCLNIPVRDRANLVPLKS